MESVDKRIGLRIQQERTLRQWSLSDLAEKSGVSRAMINRVERGESSPTAALLAKLSGALGLTMSTLVARADMSDGQVLRADDQPMWTDPATGYIRRHLSPNFAVPLDLVQIDLPPGQEVPFPAASYAFLRQLIWVMAGTLTFQEGDRQHVLNAGDCLALGPPSDCAFRNMTKLSCRYVVVALRTFN